MKKSRFSKLKGLLVEKGMRQQDFAESIGMNNTAFNRRLNEHIDFSSSEIEKICNVLNIPDKKIVEYFFN
jgi:DNA-binding Xre family transcriptional regulator